MTTWTGEEAVNALMDRFAKPCIRVHRPFPPPRVRRGRSKLGGLPNLPPPPNPVAPARPRLRAY